MYKVHIHSYTEMTVSKKDNSTTLVNKDHIGSKVLPKAKTKWLLIFFYLIIYITDKIIHYKTPETIP